MAYRPDDPYNTGIGTPDLGLDNIDQGQNIQTAGVWGNIMPEFMGGYSKEEKARNAALEQIQGLRKDQMKGIPTVKDPVGQKEIIENLQYTNPDKLKQYQDYEKQIEELKKQHPKDVNIQSAYLDDDETPYDFSGIQGQTAFLPTLGLPALFGLIKGGLSKEAITKAIIRDLVTKQIGKKTKPLITKKIREIHGEKFGGTGKFKYIATGTKDYGPHTKPKSKPKIVAKHSPHGGGGGGSKGTHSTQGGGGQKGSMPTGTAGKNPWGRADGGLINFFKNGGFLG